MADYNENAVSESEKALVAQWQKRIGRAKKANKKFFKRVQTFRNYQYGIQHADNKTGLVRTNLIYSTLATLLPSIYAKNPDVSVTPTEIVAKDQYEAVKKMGKTFEILLDNKVIKEANLKENAKANCRATMVTSYGVLKMDWQEDYKKDSIMEQRVQDAQDNLARIEKLIASAEDYLASDHEAAKAELANQTAALNAAVEIKVYSGFAIDRIRTEDFLILDEGIDEFHQYKNAKALDHMVWMTSDQIEEMFQRKPYTGSTPYKTRSFDTDTQNQTEEQKEQTEGMEFYCVHEIWDKQSNTVLTWIEGENCWCRPPRQPENMPKRWYPFYILAFNIVEGRWLPISDVELLQELQDEYNMTRTAYAEHRKESLPVRLFRVNGTLTEEDMKNIKNRKAGQMIGIEGTPNQPLGNDFAEFKNIPIDPQVYDVSAIRNDMDLMSGLSDASRGNLIQPKTATEAEIMSQNMNSRVDERRDTTEDWLTEIFQGALETMLLTMNENEVKTICGEDAVWPELTKEAVWANVRLTVRGGSTTKPNKMRERETWTQLLPQIQQTMQTVMELRQGGEVQMATAAIELLRETLTRFDEHIDLDMFIPSQDKEDELTQVVAQLQEAQKQLAEMQDAMPELQKAADTNNAKIEEGKAKAAIEKYRQDGETARTTEQIKSNERIAVANATLTLLKSSGGDSENVIPFMDQLNNLTTEVLGIANVAHIAATEGQVPAVDESTLQEQEDVIPASDQPGT